MAYLPVIFESEHTKPTRKSGEEALGAFQKKISRMPLMNAFGSVFKPFLMFVKTVPLVKTRKRQKIL